MTSKQLSPEDVHAVGVAAVENAVALMADAHILLGAGRPRRAYALGVIAVEEVAKFLRCRSILRRWTKLTVADLNDALRPGAKVHLQRYAETLAYLWSFTPSAPLLAGVGNLGELAREDMKAGERVPYVEVAPSGVPMTPHGVREEEARTWVSAMGRYFVMFQSAWRDGIDDDLSAAKVGPQLGRSQAAGGRNPTGPTAS
jgi:AbiV family abortive infection protein